MELDPGATTTNTDTESLSAQNDIQNLLCFSYGTVGMFISEGGLDVEDTLLNPVAGQLIWVVLMVQ